MVAEWGCECVGEGHYLVDELFWEDDDLTAAWPGRGEGEGTFLLQKLPQIDDVLHQSTSGDFESQEPFIFNGSSRFIMTSSL